MGHDLLLAEIVSDRAQSHKQADPPLSMQTVDHLGAR